MFTWSPYPFLRILTALIFGILAAKQGYISVEYKGYLIYYSIVLIAILFGFRILKTNRHLFISGNLGLIVIFVAGCIRFWDYSEINSADHIIHLDQDIDGYTARVNSTHLEKEKYFTYEIDLSSIFQNDNIFKKSGKVHLYVRRANDSKPTLRYGDKIVISKSPFRLPPPKNPHEFNYMDYMAGRNIYFQQFVDADEIKVTSNNPEWWLMDYAIQLRTHFSKTIENNVAGQKEQAIAKALILGIRDGLDNQVKRSFSAAGAMHVLAVSGLHVGIIIAIISFLLKPISKRRNGKVISAVVSLSFLWLYAMVAGLSPSILRAATMFSVMVIGQAYNTRQNIYNSLALSAAILLFINPNYLFSVGFQLSYIAVLGIVYIYPLIHRKLVFNNFILEQMWSFTCLSIAAQLATFPLTVYYFHQFPVYFLISNLMVIPAAMLIMTIGIALLLLGTTPLASLIGALLNGVIFSLHSVVSFIEQLDYSLIDWLYLSPFQTLLIYLMIISTLAFLNYRRFQYIYIILLIAIGVSITDSYSLFIQSNKNQLVFYEIGGEAVFDEIDGLNAKLLRVNPIKNQELVRFQVEPNRLSSQLQQVRIDAGKDTNFIASDEGLLYYHWKGNKFIFITKPVNNLITTKKIVTDYLVISNNSCYSLNHLKSHFTFRELIIDSSNNYKTCKSFEKSAKKENVKCRILRNEGAIVINNLSLSFKYYTEIH